MCLFDLSSAQMGLIGGFGIFVSSYFTVVRFPEAAELAELHGVKSNSEFDPATQCFLTPLTQWLCRFSSDCFLDRAFLAVGFPLKTWFQDIYDYLLHIAIFINNNEKWKFERKFWAEPFQNLIVQAKISVNFLKIWSGQYDVRMTDLAAVIQSSISLYLYRFRVRIKICFY